MQKDSTSRKRKAPTMGEVCLPFFPCELVLKTEKTKHCSHSEQPGKILQKWARSSCNTNCSMENAFAFFTYFFHLLWLSFSATQHHVACPSCVHKCQNIRQLFHSCWSALSSMVKPSSFIAFSLSCTPSSSPSSLSFLHSYPFSFHFNQGSFLIKTNKYVEAINVLKEADGGIVPFRYCIKP